jgi:hypothetical protein
METRLPWVPSCSWVRTETGTGAISGPSGSASWSISHRRGAPAHNATTTSLTVTPSAFFTRLTSGSGRLAKPQRRCWVMDRLNGVRGAAGEQLGRGRLPLRPARRRLGQLATLRRQVEQCGEDVVAGHAVDGGMVDLAVDRRPPAPQPEDQVDLPERSAALQRPGVQAGGLLGELPVAAGGGQGKLPDVELDVEVRVLDPVRLVQAQRHVDQAAAEERDQWQP